MTTPLVISRLAALPLAALFVATSARSQGRPRSDQLVPRDLIIGLLAANEGSNPELLVGEMPSFLMARIPVPSGGRLLGTMVTGSSASLVIEMPGRADSLRTFLERALPEKGWRAAPLRGTRSLGGFQPASALTPGYYCADGRILSFGVVARNFGSALAKLTVRDGPESFCAPPEGPSAERVEFVGISSTMRPTLMDPADVRPAPPNCRNVVVTSGPVSSNAVTTTLGADELMTHYARQLADSGWIPRPDSLALSVRAKTWTRPLDRMRQVVTLIITTPASQPGCHAVRLESGMAGPR